MSIAGGLPLAIDRAVATGCEAIQIFTKSSGQWRSRPLPVDEVDRFRQRVDETGIGPNVAHASYLINLASPDPALWRRSKSALIDELERADALGLAGVVLHPGAYTTSTEADGLDRIADGIAGVLDEHPPGSAQLLTGAYGRSRDGPGTSVRAPPHDHRPAEGVDAARGVSGYLPPRRGWL